MDLKCFIYLLILSHSGVFSVTAAHEWSYSGQHGPTHWPGLCLTGTRQSPINIPTDSATKADLGSLKFIRYDFAFPGNITNNGHSIQIKLSGVPIHLEGANLPTTYILEQIHFHWPAEHTVDNNRDALELHFVHYNNKYNNASVASQHENGIAVVAVLFKLNSNDNLEIIPILKATESISNEIGKSTELMEPKIIPALFLPKDHTTYYNYEGSLTTPGCQETVKWFILTEKLSISLRQLNIFKSVGTINGTLSFNYRPVQALGQRKVYHHLDQYSTATFHSYNLFYMCSVLLISNLL